MLARTQGVKAAPVPLRSLSSPSAGADSLDASTAPALRAKAYAVDTQEVFVIGESCASVQPMRVVVCGSREWSDWSLLEAALSILPPGSQVVHGGARGADRMAGSVAHRLGHFVAWMPADWERYGRSAGMRRNEQMLECVRPELVIAFWDGSSLGTKNTINRARRAGIRVAVFKS